MRLRIFIILSFFVFLNSSYAQVAYIRGTVSAEGGERLHLADVTVENSSLHAYTDHEGNFLLKVKSGEEITFSVSFKGKTSQTFRIKLDEGQEHHYEIVMMNDVSELEQVDIMGKKVNPEDRSRVSTYTIDPKIPKYLPSAFNDFNKILVTLPGVSSNNEFSSQYSVRGGNYDENLVYVDGIEVYKPLLVKAGQQEGLSFINPDLVSEVEFSAGGWQPRYGDKLSSVLSVKYKVPHRFRASGSLSLLGGTAHLENATRNERVSYVLGARVKRSQYLLNTLETKGEYKPRFFDLQSYVTIDLTKRKDSSDLEKRTTLGVLTSFARNRYFVTPSKRETRFGTQDQVLNLSVDFEGKELLQYETGQAALKFSHLFSPRRKADFIASYIFTQEREFGDVEGRYRFCDIETDPNSSQFNECIFTRGAGKLYDYSRNVLEGEIVNVSYQENYQTNSRNSFLWGASYGHESIKDELSEYSFIDSMDYVTVNQVLNAGNQIASSRVQGYVQHSHDFDSSHTITYGARFNYWTMNKQLLVSPRIQYSWRPRNREDLTFKAAAGLYQQPPFYRELRNFEGILNRQLKAQSSVHFIAGSDYQFKAWGRDFKFTAEIYGKYLYNVVPYDIDNVRIRYYANNNARAYAAGADFRINGEFIRDAESWFSLGFLTTKEDLEGDGKGFIRRPTDQRIMAGIFFQDHIPNNPSLKAYINMIFGSGLPFGPPNSTRNRAAFTAPAYRRVDIGFTKLLTFRDKESSRSVSLESLWLSLEVLNILGISNTISYLWITDVNNHRYAVPNTLSAQFVNLRAIGSFR